MTATPAACQMALKEWASVLQAMERGEQLVLIRKGGLIEPGSGFEVLAEELVFYPTFEHQTVNYVRPPFAGYFDERAARRPEPGRVRFDLFGRIVHSVRTMDASVIPKLAAFHIYNDAFVTQRLKWQPDQPLMIAVVRAFRMPPAELPVVDRYAGCKSWVELDHPVNLAGAVPVLDDAAFQERLTAIRALC